MTLVEFANIKLAIETILAQIFIIASVIYILFLRKQFPKVLAWIGNYGILLAFLASLAATTGSLFYSEIAKFTPCDLCWFQRIFMYPLVILLGMALWKKDRRILDYALGISIIGWIISLYQNYIYYSNGGLSAICKVGSGSVSCVVRYVLEFGYITIPVMALTAFSLVIMFLVFAKLYHETVNS
jgi:disulfide bond formation protein DsbB